MGDVVNLRRARKQRVRKRDEAAAAANRLSHGVAKATQELLRAERERAERALDGRRREGDDNEA